MKYDVVVETAQAELVAAVRAAVPISDIARAWKPALMMGMEDIILDRISFGGVKELRELYE